MVESSEWSTTQIDTGTADFSTIFHHHQNLIMNEMKMFVDDTKLWIKLTSAEDSISFQMDLDSLQAWSVEWKLHFNPKKCNVMHIRTFL